MTPRIQSVAPRIQCAAPSIQNLSLRIKTLTWFQAPLSWETSLSRFFPSLATFAIRFFSSHSHIFVLAVCVFRFRPGKRTVFMIDWTAVNRCIWIPLNSFDRKIYIERPPNWTTERKTKYLAGIFWIQAWGYRNIGRFALWTVRRDYISWLINKHLFSIVSLSSLENLFTKRVRNKVADFVF